MEFFSKSFKLKDLGKHETKKHVLFKFLILLCIFVAYFIFISSKYGVEQGLFVSFLTWSFFVLCTPIADAGFLIDFPLRLIINIRMMFSEIFVWIIAISLNIYTILFNPDIYLKTEILVLFKHILTNIFPFWAIIIISVIGTFVSINFGDELLDKVKHKDRILYNKHKNKYKYIIMIFIFIFSIVLYDILLKQLGIEITL